MDMGGDDGAATASDEGGRGDAVRELVYRLELAGSRHRAARAEQLRVDEREVAALEQLVGADGLTPTDLAQRLGLSSGGVSVLLDRLDAAGHIERLPHPHDGRKRVVVISPAGGDWLAAYLAPITAPIERATSWLSAEDRAVLERFLDHLVALREMEAARTPRYTRARERVPTVPVC